MAAAAVFICSREPFTSKADAFVFLIKVVLIYLLFSRSPFNRDFLPFVDFRFVLDDLGPSPFMSGSLRTGFVRLANVVTKMIEADRMLSLKEGRVRPIKERIKKKRIGKSFYLSPCFIQFTHARPPSGLQT